MRSFPPPMVPSYSTSNFTTYYTLIVLQRGESLQHKSDYNIQYIISHGCNIKNCISLLSIRHIEVCRTISRIRIKPANISNIRKIEDW